MYKMNVKAVQKKPVDVLSEIAKSPPGKAWYSKDKYVKGRHFRHQFVGDVVTEREIKKLNRNVSMLIKAQTGTGKTTLVLGALLALAKKKRKRILVLVSRTALEYHYKLEAQNLEEPNTLTRHKEFFLEIKSGFGAVEVWTYQSALNRLNHPDFDASQFEFVVFDEAHFFVQDAAFAENTEAILDLCLEKLKNSKRIYLSATPECVVDSLIAKEKAMAFSDVMERLPEECYADKRLADHNLDKGPKFLIYDIESDYSYITPVFFTKVDDIVQIIKEDKTGEKYLVCTNNKARGRKIEEALVDVLAEYVDAELKETTKEEYIKALIKEEKFDNKVLIATQFLDVGVNIKDSELKNVVVFSNDPTHFLQAIGRKRVSAGERINLYVHIPSAGSLLQLHGRLLKEYWRMREDIKNYKEQSLLMVKSLPFPLYQTVVKGVADIDHNGLSLINLLWRSQQLEEFLHTASQSATLEEGIARGFLRWLGIEAKYQTCAWLGRKPNERYAELVELFEEWVGKALTKDETENFRNAVKQVCDSHGIPCGAKKTRIPDVTVINKLLGTCGLAYLVERKNNCFSIKRR